MLEKIRALYRDYEEEYRRLERTSRIGAGLFGLGIGPKNAPCHEQFAEKLERLLQEAADGNPEQIRAILAFIWFTAVTRPEGSDAASWMRLGVHSLTLPLIPRLTPAAASELLKRYEAAYPRRKRLPAQQNVVSALKKQAKA